jgi:phosphoribosyl 1,2-cyclic phosphodiesterase
LTLRFWGVRGSYPTPGASTVRYGGNTPCVEIRLGDRLFLVDAGSGIVPAGEALFGTVPKQIDLLFSHLHHDHISGLPFFRPALAGQCDIRTFCGNLGGESAKASLEAMFSPPLFPVSLEHLPPHYDHIGFKAGETLAFGSMSIATCPLFHPGGATGYRFDYNGRRVCYISDIEHTDPWPASHLVRFCKGADLVIFDCMYSSKEYAGCRGWGHSTLAAGIALCRAASVRAMAGFHHNPIHDDDRLDAMQAELHAALPGSFMARERQVVTFAAKRAMAVA